MRDFRTHLALVLLVLLGGCTTYATDDFPTREGLTQSGTFTIRADQILRLNTGATGKGYLIFQGWEQPFDYEGAKLAVLGEDIADLVGAVYNLERIEDFEGHFVPYEAEFDAGKGLTGAWGKNENGVVVYMRFEGLDVDVNLAASGARVTLTR